MGGSGMGWGWGWGEMSWVEGGGVYVVEMGFSRSCSIGVDSVLWINATALLSSYIS